MPDWRSVEKPSNLRVIDPKAFQYYYCQVRKDFEKGLICSKKLDKDMKWCVPIFSPNNNDNKDERNKTLNRNMIDLVAKNMAIDIIEGVIDKKEIANC